MTIKELSQLYWLNQEIKQYEERLAKLYQSLGASAPQHDGMPHSKYQDSVTERMAIRITDLAQTINALRIKALEEEARLTAYIDTIPEAYMRVLFTQRFVYGRTWVEVASELGGDMTADGARKACVRYLARDEGTVEKRIL